MSTTVEITRCRECPYAHANNVWPLRCRFLGEIIDMEQERFRRDKPLLRDRMFPRAPNLGSPDPLVPDNCPRPQLSFPVRQPSGQERALSKPVCPFCQGPLQIVKQTKHFLNEEQFAATKAGDYYCDKCPESAGRAGTAKTGYAYFWARQVTPKRSPEGE